jgi:hypothetical protein
MGRKGQSFQLVHLDLYQDSSSGQAQQKKRMSTCAPMPRNQLLPNARCTMLVVVLSSADMESESVVVAYLECSWPLSV